MSVVEQTPNVAERVQHRWTLKEYEAAAEAGVFGPEARLELIDGEIYDMSPQKGPHIVATRLTQAALERAFASGWAVFTQVTLRLNRRSAPEPDVVVVRGETRDFVQAPPTTAELVVEVSDTTLRFDQGPKAALYARAGVPEYWILNLVHRALEVHREPDRTAGRYQTITRHGEHDTVTPLAAPDATITVRDLLP